LSVGWYIIAFFHLLTHAIFKAILFLCAGVVIHGLGGGQDIRRIKNLVKLSPFLCSIILISSLSLGGFPFLRGFYSKDFILELIYLMGSNFLIIFFIFISTILTLLYSFRLIYYSIWSGIRFKSFNNYIDSKLIELPIKIIRSLVIFFGSLISWILFSNLEIIYLRFLVKLLNLVLIFYSIWFFFFAIFKNLKFFRS